MEQAGRQEEINGDTPPLSCTMPTTRAGLQEAFNGDTPDKNRRKAFSKGSLRAYFLDKLLPPLMTTARENYIRPEQSGILQTAGSLIKNRILNKALRADFRPRI